ncbi:hypothetical protein [Candidatus Amarolinea dominans]|uniref:hypothetical protein n=1 Tax=Candidatus Amarolinea dominans TaxID=3140696 RepID=UPI0031CC7F33
MPPNKKVERRGGKKKRHGDVRNADDFVIGVEGKIVPPFPGAVHDKAFMVFGMTGAMPTARQQVRAILMFSLATSGRQVGDQRCEFGLR